MPIEKTHGQGDEDMQFSQLIILNKQQGIDPENLFIHLIPFYFMYFSSTIYKHGKC